MKHPRKKTDIRGVPPKSRKQKEDRNMKTKPPRKPGSNPFSFLAAVATGLVVFQEFLANTVALLEWFHSQDWAPLLAWGQSILPWS